MLKNILNLEDAQQLSKNEQQSINGGKSNCINNCFTDKDCSPTQSCNDVLSCSPQHVKKCGQPL